MYDVQVHCSNVYVFRDLFGNLEYLSLALISIKISYEKFEKRRANEFERQAVPMSMIHHCEVSARISPGYLFSSTLHRSNPYVPGFLLEFLCLFLFLFFIIVLFSVVRAGLAHLWCRSASLCLDTHPSSESRSSGIEKDLDSL